MVMLSKYRTVNKRLFLSEKIEKRSSYYFLINPNSLDNKGYPSREGQYEIDRWNRSDKTGTGGNLHVNTSLVAFSLVSTLILNVQ